MEVRARRQISNFLCGSCFHNIIFLLVEPRDRKVITSRELSGDLRSPMRWHWAGQGRAWAVTQSLLFPARRAGKWTSVGEGANPSHILAYLCGRSRESSVPFLMNSSSAQTCNFRFQQNIYLRELDTLDVTDWPASLSQTCKHLGISSFPGRGDSFRIMILFRLVTVRGPESEVKRGSREGATAYLTFCQGPCVDKSSSLCLCRWVNRGTGKLSHLAKQFESSRKKGWPHFEHPEIVSLSKAWTIVDLDQRKLLVLPTITTHAHRSFVLCIKHRVNQILILSWAAIR